MQKLWQNVVKTTTMLLTGNILLGWWTFVLLLRTDFKCSAALAQPLQTFLYLFGRTGFFPKLETNGARFVKMLAWLRDVSPSVRQTERVESNGIKERGEIKFGHADNDNGFGGQLPP